MADSSSRTETTIAVGSAAEVVGIAAGVGEYSNLRGDMWKGRNGKWYRLGWGGNQWTGARSRAIASAKAFQKLGTGVTVVTTPITLYDGYSAYQEGDGFGVTRAAADLTATGAAVFGGILGFTGAATYGVTTLLNEATNHAISDYTLVEKEIPSSWDSYGFP